MENEAEEVRNCITAVHVRDGIRNSYRYNKCIFFLLGLPIFRSGFLAPQVITQNSEVAPSSKFGVCYYIAGSVVLLFSSFLYVWLGLYDNYCAYSLKG